MNLEHLATAIREKRALLFVGAGVSMNLGLPSFPQLVAHIGQELGYDPDIFSTHGDYLTLSEYYYIQRRSLGPLRSWMDRKWHEGVDIGKSDIHRLIVHLDFPVIYTTNYDTWLERAYTHHGKRFKKISAVSDLPRGPTQTSGDTQIIKFHGDFDDDETLVLTESQYFQRLSFESSLDIRLRSDLLSSVALFIGYSLSDINIRYMLYKLSQLWAKEKIASARPESYLFLTRPNPIQEAVLEDRGIRPIVSQSDAPGEGLQDFLYRLLEQVKNGKP